MAYTLMGAVTKALADHCTGPARRFTAQAPREGAQEPSSHTKGLAVVQTDSCSVKFLESGHSQLFPTKPFVQLHIPLSHTP